MNVDDHPLHALPKYGDGIGLHRVKFLMDHLDLDSRDIAHRAVVVTGSNGKGSTARIASELLGAVERPVGLFTSPHLYRHNERFRIDGEPIGDRPLLQAMDAVLRGVEAYRARHEDAIGAFEAQFVVALEALKTCRWLVLEAGIGGRYDPVRLAEAAVTALVSLDFEHTELLGKTLLEIALDKLDATASGGICILGEGCRPLAEQITVVADASRRSVEFVDPSDWRDHGVCKGWQHFDIRDGTMLFPGLRSRLIGPHQINNHAVAMALVRARLERSGLWPIADAEPRWGDAIAHVTWPGRLETICENPLVVIDVGHTPIGVRAALAGFRALAGDRPSLLVTGGSRNKHVRGMLEMLVPAFDKIICTAAHHNGLGADKIGVIVNDTRPAVLTVHCSTIEEAVARARAIALAENRVVYVAGGLFLAAEFAHTWRGGDPVKLKFF